MIILLLNFERQEQQQQKNTVINLIENQTLSATMINFFLYHKEFCERMKTPPHLPFTNTCISCGEI